MKCFEREGRRTEVDSTECPVLGPVFRQCYNRLRFFWDCTV